MGLLVFHGWYWTLHWPHALYIVARAAGSQSPVFGPLSILRPCRAGSSQRFFSGQMMMQTLLQASQFEIAVETPGCIFQSNRYLRMEQPRDSSLRLGLENGTLAAGSTRPWRCIRAKVEVQRLHKNGPAQVFAEQTGFEGAGDLCDGCVRQWLVMPDHPHEHLWFRAPLVPRLSMASNCWRL